jgi:NitT/TauT family transport system permease protein
MAITTAATTAAPADVAPTQAGAVLERLRTAVLPLAFAVALLAMWQAIAVLGSYPKVILPAPTDILAALISNFGEICRQAVPTVRDTLAGFAIATVLAIALAALMTFSRLLKQAVYPLVIVIQLVPKIAWTPLFIVWAGIGTPARLAIATFIAFFPIFIAMVAGLESTDGSLVRLCRSLTATPWRIFWQVRLPASMPYLFAGLKIAITLAVIGVIVAEFICSSEGLGFLILRSAALLRTDLILAAIVVLCVVGLASYGAIALGERWVRRWQGE